MCGNNRIRVNQLKLNHMFNIMHESAPEYQVVLQLIQDNTTQGQVILLVSYHMLKVLVLNFSITFTQPANFGIL